VLPLLYVLAGTREFVMTDLKRLCHPETLAATLRSLMLNRAHFQAALGLPDAALELLTPPAPGEPLEKSFARFSITYLAPCDFRGTAFPDGSVDAVVSRAVLEHIPPPIVSGIFREAHRILRPGGIMCHFVDNSDHWEHADKSISRIHFLKFSDSAFRWLQSGGLYQNRLRHSQYAGLLREAGFRIERDEPIVDPTALAALETFPLAPRFRKFAKEDLAAMDSCFLAVK
jgi:SAM-dependent methyltransferase